MHRLFSVCLAALVSFSALKAEEAGMSLFSLEEGSDIGSLRTRDALVSEVEEGGKRFLKMNFGTESKYPDVTFAPKDGRWNLSKYGGVSVEISNTGEQAAKVAVRVDNPGPVAENRWNTGGATIAPGKTATIRVEFGTGKGGAGYPLDTSDVSAIHIFVNRPSEKSQLVLRSMTASGEPRVALDTAGATVSGKSFPPSEPDLVRFDKGEQLRTTNLDSRSEIAESNGIGMLKVKMGAEKPYPNVILFPKSGGWNLSGYTRVEVDLVNLDEESIQVNARLDNPGATAKAKSNGGKLALDPGESGTLVINFDREFAAELREKLRGMQRTPWGARATWGGTIDPSQVVELNLYMNRPSRPHVFGVTAVRAAGTFDPASQVIPEPFFPFVDRYGQYRHEDWLNKIKTDEDLTRIKAEEKASIGNFPRPKGWNVYGGWADGPQLEATGSFYTKKHDGKWYLVDPEGRLFFSMGIDVVQVGQGGTPVDERDGWFADAPWETGETFKPFLNETKEIARGDYKGKSPRLFNFYGANLLRKYGPNWQEDWRALMPQRLMNWGFNTIGNWSDPEIIKKGKIPYTHWIFLKAKKLPWQANTRNPVPDPFDPMFEKEVRRAATQMTKGTTEDPFCIGYFVDNELTWQDEDTQGRAAMAGNAGNGAKLELVKVLKEKYGDVSKLNEAWGTKIASWETMVEAKDLPITDAGKEDLRAFSEILAHKYFETIRNVLKEVAPKKLYLGCRFADHNPQVVKVAAEYCDIVSFNIYRQTVAAWKPAAPIDKPVIIGEFHFGANDRGVFGSGLVRAENAGDRAEKFLNYITGAASNPILVGAHWFALVDEPTSGRAHDEENHGFGFVSITDTPYQEMIDASRRAATKLYPIRSGREE